MRTVLVALQFSSFINFFYELKNLTLSCYITKFMYFFLLYPYHTVPVPVQHSLCLDCWGRPANLCFQTHSEMEARGGLCFVSLQDEVGSKVCKVQTSIKIFWWFWSMKYILIPTITVLNFEVFFFFFFFVFFFRRMILKKEALVWKFWDEDKNYSML